MITFRSPFIYNCSTILFASVKTNVEPDNQIFVSANNDAMNNVNVDETLLLNSAEKKTYNAFNYFENTRLSKLLDSGEHSFIHNNRQMIMFVHIYSTNTLCVQRLLYGRCIWIISKSTINPDHIYRRTEIQLPVSK
jgi:hypothetical protein